MSGTPKSAIEVFQTPSGSKRVDGLPLKLRTKRKKSVHVYTKTLHTDSTAREDALPPPEVTVFELGTPTKGVVGEYRLCWGPVPGVAQLASGHYAAGGAVDAFPIEVGLPARNPPPAESASEDGS